MEATHQHQPENQSFSEETGSSQAGMSLTPPPFQLFANPAANTSAQPLQMLKRQSFPWQGVVISGVELLESPDGTAQRSLAPGTRVKVLSEAGEYLRVEVAATTTNSDTGTEPNPQAAAGTGYVNHEAIDDATAANMGSMVGTEATWKQPEMTEEGHTSFSRFALSDGSGPAPELSSKNTFNCWEVVILSAYQLGLVNHAFLKEFYQLFKAGATDALIQKLTREAPKQYNPASGQTPNRGDIVFFNGTSHVALASGGNTCYSFWPYALLETPEVPLTNKEGQPADLNQDGIPEKKKGEFVLDGDLDYPYPVLDVVEEVSVEELAERTKISEDDQVAVTFAAPAW